MKTDIQVQLDQIERKYKRLKYSFIGVIALLTVGVFGVAFKPAQKFDIIRAQGIIIEDANGRERILIGAPIPYSKHRVRTDTALVRKYWASKFVKSNPNKYMEWYKTYSHSTEGIVIMNELGFDRVLLGDKLADANTGKRMYEAAGITWNDKQGMELGGAGVNTDEDGNSSTAIGLDDPSEGGSEAIHMVAFSDGTKGIIIGGGQGSKAGQLLMGTLQEEKTSFTGFRFSDINGNLIWEQDVTRPDTLKKK